VGNAHYISGGEKYKILLFVVTSNKFKVYFQVIIIKKGSSIRMDKRFNKKDLILLLSLGFIILLIILSMYMVDRQWLKMTEIQRSMEEQAEDIRGLRGTVRLLERQIKSGVTSAKANNNPAFNDLPDTFKRAYKASLKKDYAEGDWFVNAFSTSLKTLTPLISQDVYASYVQDYIFESLLSRNPDSLEWEGLIANSWQTSKDGLTITFDMRSDVKFSDGKALTAEDVVFTFNFIMDERIAAPRDRAYLEKIDKVTAADKYSVIFEFKEPYFNALSLAGSLKILPKHFYQIYLTKPQVFNESKGLLLGSGPYRIKDPKGWTPDQGIIELGRNPRYWAPVSSSFDRIIWKIIENDSARLTTFRNQEIDMYSSRPIEYKKLLNDKQLIKRTQHFNYMNPVSGYSYIAWNQKRQNKSTRFKDKRVRQAMTYLTDRDRLNKEIWLGYAETAISPFSPRSKQHDKSLKPRKYNPAKAKELLLQAGYKDSDGDGVLEDKQGHDFSFEMIYSQDSEDSKRMVLFLKDLYARAGIILKPKPSEWSVMIDLLTSRDFDAITLGWTSGVETDIYQYLHGNQVDENADNFVHYINPELDKVIDIARATVDEDKRMPLWQKAERIIYEDQPYTFLVRRQSLSFIDKRLKNLKVTNLGLNLGFIPVEIYVPNKQQKYHN